jgi:hypothetical protein
MVLHPLASICPGGPTCSGLGTCNILTGACACLFGWGGVDCTTDLLPSCRMPTATAFNASDPRRLTQLHFLFSSAKWQERSAAGDPWQVLFDAELLRFFVLDDDSSCLVLKGDD